MMPDGQNVESQMWEAVSFPASGFRSVFMRVAQNWLVGQKCV